MSGASSKSEHNYNALVLPNLNSFFWVYTKADEIPMMVIFGGVVEHVEGPYDTADDMLQKKKFNDF